MAWSETMFIIQHFYNVFDIDNRLTSAEYKFPLVAADKGDNKPELPEGVDVEDLTPGLLWFIQDKDDSSMISAVSVLQEDGDFADPIPFKIDLAKLSLNSELQDIISSMELTAENYYDIIKEILEKLKTVPVKNGGTGLQNIAKDQMLIGGDNNIFTTIDFDTAPTANSSKLLKSGAIYTQLERKAPTKHDSPTKKYGVGNSSNYGHLKITDDYKTVAEDSKSETAISLAGINQLLDDMQNLLNMFQVITEEVENDTLYSGRIVAYRPDGMKQTRLKLIDAYFSIDPNTEGGHTLKIK